MNHKNYFKDYTFQELTDSLTNIDEKTYPDNYNNLVKEIFSRRGTEYKFDGQLLEKAKVFKLLYDINFLFCANSRRNNSRAFTFTKIR